jgi:hypothetical protein
MGLFKNDDESKHAADVVANMEREIGTTVVALRQRSQEVVQRPNYPSEYNSAYWLRSMRYEEMMVMARNMYAQRGVEPIETAEQLAAWLIRWAKSAQENFATSGSTEAGAIDTRETG